MNLIIETTKRYSINELNEHEFTSICDGLNMLIKEPMSETAREYLVDLLYKLGGNKYEQ